MRPGDPPTVESATNFFNNLFFNPDRYDLSKVGRLKLNHRLKLNIPLEQGTLRKEDILEVVRYVADVGRRRIEGKDSSTTPLILWADELTALLGDRQSAMTLLHCWKKSPRNTASTGCSSAAGARYLLRRVQPQSYAIATCVLSSRFAISRCSITGMMSDSP